MVLAGERNKLLLSAQASLADAVVIFSTIDCKTYLPFSNGNHNQPPTQAPHSANSFIMYHNWECPGLRESKGTPSC